MDRVRVSAIRTKVQQLRAINFRDLIWEECEGGGCIVAAKWYEDTSRELCDEVEGLLREVERGNTG